MGRFLQRRFVQRVHCDEDASQEDMLNAFNTFKELNYHDVRLSIEDFVKLIRSMLSHYTWDHYV